MSRLQHVQALMEKYSAKNYQPLPINIVEADGCWVWTEPGKQDEYRFLDCLAAYGSLNQGYNHPRIIAAAKRQLATGVTITSRAFLNTPMAELSQLLADVTNQDKVVLMNTGAEAVETALKLARKWGYKKKGVKSGNAKIIACANNFHGRTISTVSLSTEEQYRDGFSPFTPGFEVIPYGDIDALKNAMDQDTVGFLLEPVQGEAGVIFPPAGFLQESKRVCEQNNVLFMADCIQSGWGRTGKLFAVDWEQVRPDMIILAKAMGGGFPSSAVCTSDQVMRVLNPGDHGSTFGGNPFCAAVALEAIKVVLEEKLPENSNKMGKYFLEELKKIDSPHVKEYRGKGLWIAIELNEQAGGARRFCEALADRKILCKETHQHIIRIAPPLIITKQEIDWALPMFKEVLTMD